MLTNGEVRILRCLLASPAKHYSINQLAKLCKLAPNGAYKILKKLEREEILKPVCIANIKSYRLAFENQKTRRVAELVLSPSIFNERVVHRVEDLKPLQEVTLACVLFGSYITAKTKPGDLDVLFVLDRENYKKYSNILDRVRQISPVKIHDVIQTKEDIKDNLRKQDAAVISAIREGIVLWGQEILVEVIKDVYKD